MTNRAGPTAAAIRAAQEILERLEDDPESDIPRGIDFEQEVPALAELIDKELNLPALHDLLVVVERYLSHPEVNAIPFSLPPGGGPARAVRNVIADLESV